MILIVGLGNPGKKYIATRHNIGWLAIDEFAKKIKADGWRLDKKSNSLVTKKKDLIIIKPQTFMNASGLAVNKVAQFYKIKLEDIWVVHDDIDLGLGKLKIVKNRGSAGHRGIESIINNLRTIGFIRFRLGVSHPRQGRLKEGGKRADKFDGRHDVSDFVLDPFLTSERDEIKRLIKKTVKALEVGLEKDIEAAMNRYN